MDMQERNARGEPLREADVEVGLVTRRELYAQLDLGCVAEHLNKATVRGSFTD